MRLKVLAKIILFLLITPSYSIEYYNLKQWHDLLHMVNGKSQIDDERFFLSPDGKTNPKAEFEATIKAFYKKIPTTKEELDKNQYSLYTQSILEETKYKQTPQDMHAICLFPARFKFITEYMKLENLPTPQCESYKNTKEYINPQKATIVFASAHVNSPASMFGHTFLVLDSNFESRMLSYAFNYAANADEKTTNGIIFAIKGVFGGYDGMYSMMPYYDKIKEYAQSESRDMWEFELDFDKKEVQRLYDHIWELRGIKSEYFFFDENCSYNILWNLEVARPSLSLRNEFLYQVSPVETLFAMNSLFRDTKYRPSKRTKILAYQKLLSSQEIHIVEQIINKNIQPQNIANLDPQRQRYILETSAQMNEYNFIKQKISKDYYTSLAYSIASSRSTLGKGDPLIIPTPPSPLKQNRSLRITPTIFYSDEKWFAGMDFRPTFHDITESNVGFLEGTQIEFFKILAGINLKNGSLRIEDATLLSIASLSPTTQLLDLFSYRLSTGAKNQNNRLMAYISGGFGRTYEFFDKFYAYYLLEPTIYLQQLPSLSNVFGGMLDYQGLKISMEYANTISNYAKNSIDTTLDFSIRQNLSLMSRYKANFLCKDTQCNDYFSFGLRMYF